MKEVRSKEIKEEFQLKMGPSHQRNLQRLDDCEAGDNDFDFIKIKQQLKFNRQQLFKRSVDTHVKNQELGKSSPKHLLEIINEREEKRKQDEYVKKEQKRKMKEEKE